MKNEYVEVLLNEYLEKIYFFALKKTASKDEADDLAQEIVSEVLTSLSRGSKPVDFAYWMWAVARNHYSKWAKNKNKLNQVMEMDDSAIETAVDKDLSVEEQIIYNENIYLLKRELSLLTSYYRDITVAYYIKGEKIGNISKKLNLPEGTVKRRLYESRKNLKEGMKMARKNGQKSYAPENIYFVFSRKAPQGNIPDELVERLIPKNILIEAYNNPCTIEELSLELGIAVPYMEDEVKRLVEGSLLKKLQDGMYETDFVIVDKETQKDLYDKTAKVCRENMQFLISFAYGMAMEYDIVDTLDCCSALNRMNEAVKKAQASNQEGINHEKEMLEWAQKQGYNSYGEAINDKISSKIKEWKVNYRNKTSLGNLTIDEAIWFTLFYSVETFMEITAQKKGISNDYIKNYKGQWDITGLEEWEDNDGNCVNAFGSNYITSDKSLFVKYHCGFIPQIKNLKLNMTQNELVVITDIIKTDKKLSQLTLVEKDIVNSLFNKNLLKIDEDTISAAFPVLDMCGIEKFKAILQSIEIPEGFKEKAQEKMKMLNNFFGGLYDYYIERIQKNAPKRLEEQVKRVARQLIGQLNYHVLNSALESGCLAMPEETEHIPFGMCLFIK